MGYLLKCPICRAKFKWNPLVGFPDYCPNAKCTSRIAHDRKDDDVVMPFVRSPGTKANDDLYRSMEKASEARAEHAAQILGVPTSDMSDLKITNLNDRRHEGAVAAMPVNNEVTRMMAAAPQQFGMNPNAGLQYSATVSSGPYPNSGARTQNMIRSLHTERMSGASLGGVSTDAPALETQNPNYRRRV